MQRSEGFRVPQRAAPSRAAPRGTGGAQRAHWQLERVGQRRYRDAEAALPGREIGHLSPIDRTRSLAEIGADIATAETELAAIEIRADGSAPAEGLSRAEVTERVSAQIDKLLDARVGALHDNLAMIRPGRHDVELLADQAQEPPHDSDFLGAWTAQALGQASSGTLAMLVLLLGKPALMAALQPHIERLPTGLPAAERGKRLTEIRGRLDALYRHEASLLLDDDGSLLLDVIPRRGMKAEYLVLVEAA